MEFKSKNFVIRPWKKGDEKALSKNANNKKIARNMFEGFPSPYTEKDAKDWIKVNEEKKKKTDFAIIVDEELAGGIGFNPHKKNKNLTAEIGYWLGEKYWGRGIATQALKIITKYGFEKFKLKRIQAKVYTHDLASAKVLEKAGYKFEGNLRKNVLKNGKLLDELIYAKIK